MRGFLHSWGDSLKLLLPRNLMQWVLVTAKGTIETYKVLLKHLWWLLGLLAINYGFLFYFHKNAIVSLWAQSVHYTVVGLIALWLFFSFVVARPSVDKKDRSYFATYAKRGPLAFGVAVLLALVVLLVSSAFLFVGSYLFKTFKLFTPKTPCCPCGYLGLLFVGSFAINTLLLLPSFFGVPGFCLIGATTKLWVFGGLAWLLQIALSPLLLFSMLFLLDSRPSVRALFASVKNGIKLAWYTYPLCLLLFCLFKGIGWLVGLGVIRFGLDIFLILMALLYPLYVNTFMYLYNKQIYEQPERYQ